MTTPDSDRPLDPDANALERGLRRAPSFLAEYGSYLLLAAVLAVALVWFYNSRRDSEQLQQQATSQALVNMARVVDGARQLRTFAAVLPSDDLDRRKAELASEFEAYAPLAAEAAGDDGARAHGLRLRGDFGWIMATFPAGRPATRPAATQPAEDLTPAPATRPAGSWLDEATAAYTQLIERYPGPAGDNLAALFGLAAVAEQRGDFDAAAGRYDAVMARPEYGESAKAAARDRKALLPLLGTRPYLAPPRPPETSTLDVSPSLPTLPARHRPRRRVPPTPSSTPAGRSRPRSRFPPRPSPRPAPPPRRRVARR